MAGYVYKLYREGVVVYVGKTLWLSNRVSQHKQKEFDFVGYFEVDEQHLLAVEAALIEAHSPVFNKIRPQALLEEGEKLLRDVYFNVKEKFLDVSMEPDVFFREGALHVPYDVLSLIVVEHEGKQYRPNMTAKLLYAFLLENCENSGGEFRKDQRIIASALGICDRTANTALSFLVEAGMIIKITNKIKGAHVENSYRIVNKFTHI